MTEYINNMEFEMARRFLCVGFGRISNQESCASV